MKWTLGVVCLLGLVGGQRAQANDEDLAPGTISYSSVKTIVQTCATGVYGKIWDTNLGWITCPPPPPPDDHLTADITFDDDAQALFDGTSECKIVNEYDTDENEDECVDEPASSFAADGSFTTVRWKLIWHKISTGGWLYQFKERRTRWAAHLDKHCGAEDTKAQLVADWIVDHASCAISKCDDFFSSSTMPQCNTFCKALMATRCNGSGGGGTCGAFGETQCTGMYNDGAGPEHYCSVTMSQTGDCLASCIDTGVAAGCVATFE